VGHANDKDQHFLGANGIGDDIVSADMDSAEFAAPLKLLRSFAARIVRQEVKPASNPLLYLAGKGLNLLLGSGREGDAVSHGSQAQPFLDSLPRNRLLAGPLELIKRLAALLRPIAVFKLFQEPKVFFAHEEDGLSAPALNAHPLSLVGHAVERVRGNPGSRCFQRRHGSYSADWDELYNLVNQDIIDRFPVNVKFFLARAICVVAVFRRRAGYRQGASAGRA